MNLERENFSLRASMKLIEQTRKESNLKGSNVLVKEKERFIRENTIDLTQSEEVENHPVRRKQFETQEKPTDHETFIKKMQKSSLSKRIPNIATQDKFTRLVPLSPSPVTPSPGRSHDNDEEHFKNFLNLSKPIIAESTNFLQTNPNQRRTQQELEPLQGPKYVYNVSSGGRRSSSIMSVSSHGSRYSMKENNNEQTPGIRLGSSSGGLAKRPIRPRSATTQSIVQRLSAHMKVSGGLQNVQATRSRPGSMYNKENINPKSPYFRRG